MLAAEAEDSSRIIIPLESFFTVIVIFFVFFSAGGNGDRSAGG